MTTATQALATLRARLDAADSGIAIPLRWHGDQQDALPDTPSVFAHIVFNNEGSGRWPAAYGGGVGSNLYRNRAHLEVYVFGPRDEGMSVVMDHAETIAARLRSFRDEHVSCFSADVIPVGKGSSLAPPGLSSDVSNYQCAIAAVELHFDQIG